MNGVKGGVVSGVMCEWPDRLVPSAQHWECLQGVAANPIHHGKWKLLSYRTPFPLISEDIPADGGMYHYEFLVRPTTSRALILGAKHRHAENFLGRQHLQDSAKYPRVEVEKLVEDLCEKPHEFLTLSRIYAGVEEFGKDLTSITIYGDNLVKRSIQALLGFHINPFRIELSDVRFGRKLLSINKRGEISFSYIDDRSLKQVDDTLHILNRGGYFKWGDQGNAHIPNDIHEGDA